MYVYLCLNDDGMMPLQVLCGHMSSVMQVCFVKTRAQLVSFSKDKVLMIWDVQLQTCLQRIAGIFPKLPEGQLTRICL